MPISTQGIRISAIAAIVLGGIGAALAAAELSIGPQSGLPLPRFVSLKADRVNVRAGPTREHEVAWIYTQSGLPVEITAEYQNWRRIRDWESAEGWVYHSLLSGRRTALVLPRDRQDLVPLHLGPSGSTAILARLQSGVLGTVRGCNGSWCRIVGRSFDGWVEQNRVWGVYPNEKLN